MKKWSDLKKRCLSPARIEKAEAAAERATQNAAVSLLEKALAVSAPPRRTTRSDKNAGRAELAMAYIAGRVTGLQAAVAIGCSLANARTYLALALLTEARAGRIRIEVVK